MDFYSKLAPVIFSTDPAAAPDYFVQHKLLADSCECIHCNKPMVLHTRPTKSRVSLSKWMYILYLWSQDTMMKKAAENTSISQKTIVQIYQYLRDVWRMHYQTTEYTSWVRQLWYHCPDRWELVQPQTKVPERSTSWRTQRDVGLWNSRYLPYTGNHLHADCRQERCCYPFTHYSEGSRFHSSFRPVGCLEKDPTASQPGPPNRQPLHELRRPRHRSPYSKHRVLLG